MHSYCHGNCYSWWQLNSAAAFQDQRDFVFIRNQWRLAVCVTPATYVWKENYFQYGRARFPTAAALSSDNEVAENQQLCRRFVLRMCCSASRSRLSSPVPCVSCRVVVCTYVRKSWWHWWAVLRTRNVVNELDLRTAKRRSCICCWCDCGNCVGVTQPLWRNNAICFRLRQ